MRRNSSGHALPGIDCLAERSSILRRVLVGHRTDVQILEPLLGHREADETSSVLGHEVDQFGRNLLGSKGKIAFVLAVLVIDHDNHPPRAYLFNRVRNIGKWTLQAHNAVILSGAQCKNCLKDVTARPEGCGSSW